MSEQKESVLVDGMFFKKPIETAPDFVKGHVSIKAKELMAFIEKHQKADGWVNIDLLKSKDGSKLYFKLNTWEPPKKDEAITPEDIPFNSEPSASLNQTYIFIREVKKWGVEAGDYYSPDRHRVQGGTQRLLDEKVIEPENTNYE
jgi:hypothetical protein